MFFYFTIQATNGWVAISAFTKVSHSKDSVYFCMVSHYSAMHTHQDFIPKNYYFVLIDQI